jgi:hypothetical protein
MTLFTARAPTYNIGKGAGGGEIRRSVCSRASARAALRPVTLAGSVTGQEPPPPAVAPPKPPRRYRRKYE